MRHIDPQLQNHLDSGATTLCRCWRVRRQDGQVMGFTDHDRDLAFEGVVFKASSGMDASALQSTTGLNVDNGQVYGALNATDIREKDILAGRYDKAEVDQWLVSWTDPELRVHMFRGFLGEIRRTETAFEAELRGLTEKLNVPVGRTILRTCDRSLGDGKCRFDLTAPGYTAEGQVGEGSQGARVIVAGLADFAEEWFTHGTVRWLTGENMGLVSRVKRDSRREGSRVLDLWEEPPLGMTAGDSFSVSAGCDKTAATCRTKFDNFLNFRGFSHIPGEDWVVAYPKEGSVHDGSSLQRR
jgi:uncharacterized phage protein (TIGR02218 family)